MTFAQFKESIKNNEPPQLDVLLLSLWYDGRGDWEKTHDLVNDLEGKEAARMHAYLHRKEGDQSNASYWYNRAKTTKPSYSLQEEWEEIVIELLRDND